ncbi:electron transport complex subunit RsxC [Halopseudomonas salina]|uniref:Ion-translocating oxidoreductase complex subunit C n=1 Tax=Halopseudomonas salina TaxID=1323744 RepID=A0ABQ1P3S0_9GAMM|nr:electron transport complex subunit RsxC [Halopseudomonas salina]GGC90523.1 electron transport complex subunit C [Halopseudomonas salina]
MEQPIRIWDIHGGIHPEENKHQSVQRGLETPPLPKRLILPLLQHIGARSEPVVAVGDSVLKGQMLAEASGMVSSALHAPTSGTVTAIGPAAFPHASGLEEWAITLESDGRDQWTTLQPIVDYRQLEAPSLLEIIRTAGISGMGGAGFPTSVKLKARPEQKIHTLIINGTECEPYITADDTAMRYRAPEVVSGIEILMHILKPDEVLIGIEDNKPEALEAMRRAVGDKAMQVVSFPTKYPSGGEKQLIQILTGKEVPSGGLPADIGMVCQNIGTMIAIHDAVILGQPLISRVTTLTGAALSRPTNVLALIGTPIRDLLEFAGVQPDKLYRLVMGGPMMGFTLQSLDAPVIKTSNCLLAGTRDELPPPPAAQPCIRCGLCSEVCPAALLPQQLHWFAMGKDYDQLKRLNLFDCIECGACSYVCPSSIPLVQYYRASKAEIRALDLQQHKADHSKQRFEHRLQRLEREAEQKELERQARAEKAARMKAAKEQQAVNAASVSGEEQPDVARLEANKPTGLTADQKQLKIAAATAQMALKKARKQLASNPDSDELKAQIPELENACEQTQRAYDEALGETSVKTAPPPSSGADDEAKRLKIEAAMIRASLKKAERAAGESPTEEQQKEIHALREQVATAEARLPQVDTPKKPVDENIKKAKLDAAMAKAELKKAERSLAENPSDPSLQAGVEGARSKLNDALQKVEQSEANSTVPPPARERVDKKPIDDTTRQLKTDMAMAKAAFRKAERALQDGPDNQQLEAELTEARKALDSAAKAFADHMASKETD